MNTDRRTGSCNVPGRLPGEGAMEGAAAAGACYMASAPVEEVLFDQLEYLVAHGGQECSADCLECGRLERVKHWLLLPFRKSSAVA